MSAQKSMAELHETLRRAREANAACQEAGKLKSSFDDQWEAFRTKMDDLTAMALKGLKGVSLGDLATQSGPTRPAELISEARVAQVLRRSKRTVVLTGAGISAESGIPTFRGSDGFWTVGSENYRPQELATWEKFNEMPDELWKWYQYRWGICRKAKPNPGHHALVEMDSLMEGGLKLVTQNIDGLHLQAGTAPARLHEIHGRIDEMRCDERVEGACLHGLNLNDAANMQAARATIKKTPQPAKCEKDEHLPLCGKCGIRQRPKILWFDESYNEAFYDYDSVLKSINDCDVLLIIGTQLTTGLPSRMVRTARDAGVAIIKMDPIVDLEDPASAGLLHVQAKSGEALPRIVEELRQLQTEPLLAPLDKSQISHAGGQLLTPPKTPSPPSTPSALAQTAGKHNLGKATSASSAKPAGRTSSVPAQRRSVVQAPAAKARSTATFRAAASISLSNNNGSHKALIASSKVPPALSPSEGAPDGFFVYGTLRPDDDSGAAWTQSFAEGLSGEASILPGSSLYICGSYPAVCLEKTRCSVRGVLLTLDGPQARAVLASKLAEADRIEGYPDLYDRTVMPVQTTGGAWRRAYVYHRTGSFDRAQCVRIADGDWLSRRR